MSDLARRLTAILSADVRGYSRLMSQDEAGTVHTLNAHKHIMAELVSAHHGRVVDAPGDNLRRSFRVSSRPCDVPPRFRMPSTRRIAARSPIGRCSGESASISAMSSRMPLGSRATASTWPREYRN